MVYFRWTRLIALLVPSLALAAPPALVRDGQVLRFGNGQVEVAVAADTGRLVGFGPAGAPVLTSGQAEVAAAPANLGPGQAARRCTNAVAAPATATPGAVLVGAPDSADPGGTVLRVTSTVGDWELVESWRLWPDAPLAARTARWTYHGTGRGTVQGASFTLGGLALPGAADAELVVPGAFPVRVQPYRGFQPGRRYRKQGMGATDNLVVVRSTAAGRSVLAMTCGEVEWCEAAVQEGAGTADVSHSFGCQLALEPGTSFEVGAQVLALSGADTGVIATTTEQVFDRFGLRVTADPPPDVDKLAIYSAQVGGSIGSGFRDTGGFRAFAERLPQLKKMGFNLLWLLPFWKGSVYAPVDYAQVDPRWGTEAELKDLVTRAHALGIKVVGDLVPHGPRDESGLQLQHPDWITKQPDGSLTYTWGCLQCDYAVPGWQQFMADHAVDWMKRVGLDGYRVDVAGGGPPNWRPAPGLRPSMSGIYGARRLMAAVRAAMKRQDPHSLLIMEGTSPGLAESGDLQYDFPWAYDVLPASLRMPLNEWQPACRAWLEWQRALYPRGTRFMRYAESHDMVKAEWVYGPARHRALLALTTALDGAPMVYDAEEVGQAAAIRALLARRDTLPPPDQRIAPAVAQAFTWQPPASHEADPATRRTMPLRATQEADTVTVHAGAWQLVIDQHGGGIRDFRLAGRSRLAETAFAEGSSKLLIGQPAHDLLAGEGSVSVSEGPEPVVTVTSRMGRPAALEVIRRYRCGGWGVACEVELRPLSGAVENVSANLGQLFALPGTAAWAIHTTEGLSDDVTELLVPRKAVGGSFEYRHAASTALYDSTRLPLASGLRLLDAEGQPLYVGEIQATPAAWCQAVRLREINGQLALELAWLEGHPVSLPAGQTATLRWTLETEPPRGGPRVDTQGSNYVIENAHYRAVIGRYGGGTVRELRLRRGNGWGENLADGLHSYTDHGLYGDYTTPTGQMRRVHAGSDVDLEPDVELRQDGTKFVLSFTGTLRATEEGGRHVQQPFSWYRHEWTFDDSPRIGLRLGFRPRGGLEDTPTAAFVGHILELPGVRSWQAVGGDGRAEGQAQGKGERVWQAPAHGGARSFSATGPGGTLDVRLDSGGDKLQNVFLLDGGGNMVLFFAPYDNQPVPIPPRWSDTALTLEARP